MCGRHDGELLTHELHMVLENYINTETSVKNLQTGHATLHDKWHGHPTFTISLCDDNSAFTKSTLKSLPD